MRRGRLDGEGQLANYWHTHAAGPGGPCSEIFVDRGAQYGPDGGPDVDEDRFMEIWNLVFIQDQVDANLEIVGELPAKNIDTGSSLERVATLLQGKDNYFETDAFRPLFEVVESLSGKRHGADERDDVSLKVIAEHGRATTFLIADGVQPSNEGRGYILRRMLRRVVTHSRRLGIEGPVLEPLIRRTTELWGDVYPELRENEAFVLQVATSEEERFAATLRQGLQLFEKAVEQNEERKVLSGDDAFKLSDTFGFPLPLTQELAAEAGLTVDVDRFAELLEEQRTRARAAAKKVPIGIDAGAVPPTEFVGYRQLESDAQIVAMLDAESRELSVAEEGEDVRLFLNVTPFYAEGGGQIGDHGIIRTATGVVRVVDAQWAGPDAIMHVGLVESGEIRGDQEAHGAGRCRPAGGHGARPHVDAHRPLDAEASPGRPRASGRIARRTRPAAVRLPAPVGRAARAPGGGRARGEPPAGARRRGADLRDDVRRGEGPGRDRVVRREVRRPRPCGRGRGLLARALRRHARASDRQRLADQDPARGIDRRRDAPRRGVGRSGRAPRDQRGAGAAAGPRHHAREHRPGRPRSSARVSSSSGSSGSRPSSASSGRGTSRPASNRSWSR